HRTAGLAREQTMSPVLPLWSRYPKGLPNRDRTGTHRLRRAKRELRRCNLGIELLEDRAMPSVMLSVSDASAFEGSASMKFIDSFIAPQSGGVRNPRGIDYGPDGNLYVSGESDPSDPVQLGYVNRYDGATGDYMDKFASDPTLDGAKDVEFGPDGNL